MNLETLKRWSMEANAKHFEGKVTAQVFTYSRKGNVGGFHKYTKGVSSIHVNLAAKRTEGEFKLILLHEMVHAYLKALGAKCGHTPQFKRMMQGIIQAEFGFTPSTNVRFMVAIPAPAIALPASKEVPLEAFNLPSVPRFKVLSNGLVGDFLKEASAYGRKRILLKVEGMLFPFETDLSNVQKVA